MLANLSGVVTLGIVVMVPGATREALTIPSGVEMAQIVVIGLVAIFCHTLIIYALRLVECCRHRAFQYLEIIGATLWGYVFFAEFPDALTWVGIAIIVGSGIFVFYREQRTGS